MSTYLQITNKVLNLVGEVPLTDVSNARGIQQVALDAVNDVYFDVCGMASQGWTFLETDHTDTLADGTHEVALPTDVATVDWHSFVLLPEASDPTIGSAKHLPYLPLDRYRNTWYYSQDVENAGTTTDYNQVPNYVIRPRGEDIYWVSPVSDNDYQLKFNYWIEPTAASSNTDTFLIPVRYEQILVYGACMNMNFIRSDPHFYQRLDERYQMLINAIEQALIRRDEYASPSHQWRRVFTGLDYTD